MDDSLTKVHYKLIEEIAKKEGYNNYEIETETSSKKEGFNGVFTAVTLKGGQNILELIIKSATKDQEQRNIPGRNMFIRNIYQREIFTYERTLQEFDKFAKQVGLDYSSHAKFYGNCYDEGDECLVLENLKTRGYQLWNQNIPMNSTHAELVIKEYAKFHSISFAMKEKNPEAYQKLCEELLSGSCGVDQQTKDSFLKNSLKSAKEILKAHDPSSHKIQKLSSAFRKFVSIEKQKKGVLSVITHGDCWCNNIMFKYEDNLNPNKPTEACFIDWQLSEVGSPTNDLSYFLFICCGKDILSVHQNYLKIYTTSVIDHLRSMSCDSGQIFSVELFKSDWEIWSRHGVFLAIGLLEMLLTGTKEEKKENYRNRVLDLIEFIVETN